MTNKQIQKKESNALSVLNEDMLKELGDISATAISVREDSVRYPKLNLIQALSKPFKAGQAQLKHFYCDMKSKDYGENPTLIPLYIQQSAGWYDKDQEKLVCSSEDTYKNQDGVSCQSCPHGNYWNDWDGARAKGLKRPKCSLAFNVYFLVKEEDGTIDGVPMQFSFRVISYKAGQSLLNKIRMHPHGIPCLFGYKLKVETEKQGNFFIKEGGEIKVELTNEDLNIVIPVFKKINEMIRDRKIENSFFDNDDEQDSAEVVSKQNEVNQDIDISFPEEM